MHYTRCKKYLLIITTHYTKIIKYLILYPSMNELHTRWWNLITSNFTEWFICNIVQYSNAYLAYLVKIEKTRTELQIPEYNCIVKSVFVLSASWLLNCIESLVHNYTSTNTCFLGSHLLWRCPWQLTLTFKINYKSDVLDLKMF
jgi:hypothetical protein